MSGSKEDEEPFLEGGALALGVEEGGAGAPDGGIGGRAVVGAWCVVAPVGGTGGRVGAGSWGGGAVTLCDTSRMAALIGSMTPWSAGQVGLV